MWIKFFDSRGNQTWVLSNLGSFALLLTYPNSIFWRDAIFNTGMICPVRMVGRPGIAMSQKCVGGIHSGSVPRLGFIHCLTLVSIGPTRPNRLGITLRVSTLFPIHYYSFLCRYASLSKYTSEIHGEIASLRDL